uniref:Uncharacterized protein n=2 Tax=Picea TaxID=3328 RepID=A0A117NG15_PICGL|nr:hypothetical protein ABT39_MTgene1909 [Picea glauca]QHR89894.1 hypothetical protein Q903MT_gene3916 [Picea sitchensis]
MARTQYGNNSKCRGSSIVTSRHGTKPKNLIHATIRASASGGFHIFPSYYSIFRRRRSVVLSGVSILLKPFCRDSHAL